MCCRGLSRVQSVSMVVIWPKPVDETVSHHTGIAKFGISKCGICQALSPGSQFSSSSSSSFSSSSSLSSAKSEIFGLGRAFSMKGILGLFHLGFRWSFFALSFSRPYFSTSLTHPALTSPFRAFLSISLTLHTSIASEYLSFVSFLFEEASFAASWAA
jgi:hypothetical protein